MNIKKICIGYRSFIMSAIAVVCAFLPTLAGAATSFPVSQAGMAAYVKLDTANFSIANFDNAKLALFDSIETASATYLIGKKAYGVDDNDKTKYDFRIYLGADGWLVVYILTSDYPSYIVNWKTGAALSDTILKFAIEDAIAKIGVPAAAPFQYYNFYFPTAKKMTLIRDSVGYNNSDLTKSYNVFVPGSTAWMYFGTKGVADGECSMAYLVNGSVAANISLNAISNFSFYEVFRTNQSYNIDLRRTSDRCKASAVTLLFYDAI